MDTLRGNFADGIDFDAEAQEYEPVEDETGRDLPPGAIGQNERRMQVRAYNHWAGLLGDRNFPSIEDLNPESLDDFGPYSVLLDFSSGIDNPGIAFLGDKLAEECGADGDIAQLSDVPSRSLLSRITDHYMQILANQAPIGFEAEFVNQRGATILYRGILLPFSSDDDTIDFIFGVINWKELADQFTTDELLLEIDQALEDTEDGDEEDADLEVLRPALNAPLTDWADGPASQAIENGGQADDILDLTTPLGEEAPDMADLPQPAFGAVNDDGFASLTDMLAPRELRRDDEPDGDHLEEGRLEGDHPEGDRFAAFADRALPEDEDGYGEEDGDYHAMDDVPTWQPALPENAPLHDAEGLAANPAPAAAPPMSEPAAAFDADDDYPLIDLPELDEADMGLGDWLASARELAECARGSEDRTRQALYAAIGRAYDFSLAAADAPEEFAELVADSGLTMQDRAPMTPVVKLVFGADYDKTRLTEYATALSHGHRLGVERGKLGDFLTAAKGGLKAVVAEERRLRREESGKTAEQEDAREQLADKLRAMEPQAFDEIDPSGNEFALVMIRRLETGEVVILGEVPEDVPLLERAARKLVG